MAKRFDGVEINPTVRITIARMSGEVLEVFSANETRRVQEDTPYSRTVAENQLAAAFKHEQQYRDAGERATRRGKVA